MKRFKLKIGIDIDDVLYSCNEYAVSLANSRYSINPPLAFSDITKWGYVDDYRIKKMLSLYKEKSFFETQPILPGAVDFINELSKRAEIFFITAISPEFMGIRASRLIHDFPMVPKDNIIMGGRKDIVQVDIMLDDGAHNIVSSHSAYPVLFRRPWNQHMSGCLSVNNYDEFLMLVDSLASSYLSNSKPTNGNNIYCFVGPSGSGKTAIVSELVRQGFAFRPKSYTTRKPRSEADHMDYHFCEKKEFIEKESSGYFFESTRYAGECYGSTLSEVTTSLLDKNVAIPVDICGAIAIKKHLPQNSFIVYVKRDKRKLIESILSRDCSNEDKANRIISLSDEIKNEQLADIVIENNKSIYEVCNEFMSNL